MNTDQLKEYIGVLADMENNIYLQEQLIETLDQKCSVLGIPGEIPPPDVNRPNKPNVYPVKVSYNDNSNLFFILAGVLAALSIVFALLSVEVLFYLFQLAAIILLAIGAIKSSLANKDNAYSNAMAAYNAALAAYDTAQSDYQRAISDDAIRVSAENKEKELIQSCIDTIKGKKAIEEKNLSNLYNLGIVYKKYRSIDAINMICEYMESGICTTLEGPNGAYKFLEEQKIHKEILLGIESIRLNLEQIKQNQFKLFTAITEGNRISEQIADSIERLSSSVDMIALSEQSMNKAVEALQEASNLESYYQERIEKELHYMNQMKYYNGEYGDGSSNPPPN